MRSEDRLAPDHPGCREAGSAGAKAPTPVRVTRLGVLCVLVCLLSPRRMDPERHASGRRILRVAAL